jgi:hypothetical protein
MCIVDTRVVKIDLITLHILLSSPQSNPTHVIRREGTDFILARKKIVVLKIKQSSVTKFSGGSK